MTPVDGVKVLRIRSGPIKGTSKAIRAVNELRLSSVIWKAGKGFFKAHPSDLIVFYSPSIFFGRLIRKLKELWNCKAYLILRDIFPQWAVDVGVLKDGAICRFFRRKERLQYDVADVIGVQSPANLGYFSQPGLKDKYHLEVLYNWTTLKEKNVAVRDDRRRLGLQDKVVFFYGGNIGVAQNMDSIIRLAANLRQHTNIYFLLAGHGSEVPRIKAKIQEVGLANISIHPAVPQEQYLGMLSQFDVGLISLDQNLKTHNFPGKMLGYMYFSMPILASINPGNDLEKILREARAGFTCLDGDDDRFCHYALSLAGDPSLRQQMGRNARAALEKTFCVSRAASQILAHTLEPPAPAHSRRYADFV
jgi:glycosyltransferase involved in cell wall biosynthesis